MPDYHRLGPPITRRDVVNDAKTNRPRRSWIQFNVRAALIGVAAAAVFLGLEVNWARKQTTAVAAVKAYGGFVHYDHEYVKGAYVPGREPLALQWLRRAIGDDFFRTVVEVIRASRPSPRW
jgi:hypothetical protein